ncbi:MAG: adenylate/guanylate cyclase domain-containing protein [Burkholderiales bacterium]
MPDLAQTKNDSVSILRRLSHSLISPSDSEDVRWRKKWLLIFCLLMNLAAWIWPGIYWAMGLRFPFWIPVAYLIFTVLTLLIYWKTKKFDLFRSFHIFVLLFVPFIIQWKVGTFINSSGIVLLALLAPMGVLVFQGVKESIPWFVAYLVLTAVSGFFDFYLAEGVVTGIPMKTISVFFVLNFFMLSIIVYLLILFFVRKKDMFQAELGEKNLLIESERQKSEELLLKILPEHIASRLKGGEKTIARGYEDVTVMFADLVDFTWLAERMPPRHVVKLLGDVFLEFDRLTDKYGLEKIKTIGDAYMVAGGLSEDEELVEYAEAVAHMALDMLDLIKQHPVLSHQKLEIHVGIATGPAVAGVINTEKRLIYDLWGPTVNLASRITSGAVAGTIQVDETTYRRLNGRFSFEQPHTIELKGKGKVTVYQLAGK